jgi:alkanesulfonate monooxygenase SsuD/methylene tetrahydromethanopterin reductase-like flavin-dependent oxidoreductase (luciferase family)
VPVMRTIHIAESDAEARRVTDASEAEFAAIASRARGAIAVRAAGTAADRVIIGTASAVADRIAAYRERVVIDHLIVRPASRIGDDARLRSLEALSQLVAG